MILGQPSLIPTTYKLSVETRARIERIRLAWCMANEGTFIRQHISATDVIRGLVNREIERLDKEKEEREFGIGIAVQAVVKKIAKKTEPAPKKPVKGKVKR